MRKDLEASAMRSLTSCQVIMSRVGVNVVRTNPTALSMEFLTLCQANRTKVGMNVAVRMDWLHLV